MEYAGATSSGTDSLYHELNHSYFARHVLPGDGDAGWIDEAIASWQDNGFPELPSIDFKTNMGSRGMYIRYTDSRAYSEGMEFMGYLQSLLKKEGGLIPFLKQYHDQWKENHIYTLGLQGFLEKTTGRSFAQAFQHFIMNPDGKFEGPERVNPHHPQWTAEQIKEKF
jgi:hypothetical protein